MKKIIFFSLFIGWGCTIGTSHKIFAMNECINLKINIQISPLAQEEGLLTPEFYTQRATQFLQQAFLGLPLDIGQKTYQTALKRYLRKQLRNNKISLHTQQEEAFCLLDMFRTFFSHTLSASDKLTPLKRMHHYFKEMVEENFCWGWCNTLSRYPLELLGALPASSKMLACLTNFNAKENWQDTSTEEFLQLTKHISTEDVLFSYLIETRVFARAILVAINQAH